MATWAPRLLPLSNTCICICMSRHAPASHRHSLHEHSFAVSADYMKRVLSPCRRLDKSPA